MEGPDNQEIRTILIRTRKADHILRQDLRHATHPRGHHIEPCARGFKDGDAEGLCEGGVHEDRALYQYLCGWSDEGSKIDGGIRGSGREEGTHGSYVLVADGPKELDSVL